MSVIVYMPVLNENGRTFLEGVRRLPSRLEVEVFDTQTAFIKRVRQPNGGFLIAVLFDPSHEDLEGVRSAREFLANVPLLLVLSDQDPMTMALAHRLLPSYITYVDSDMGQLYSVIRKLLPEGGVAPEL